MRESSDEGSKSSKSSKGSEGRDGGEREKTVVCCRRTAAARSTAPGRPRSSSSWGRWKVMSRANVRRYRLHSTARRRLTADADGMY